jgi:acetolactate synthase I/II/III large subunit
MMTLKNKQQTAAQLLIRSLVQQKVRYIFGIPGGKIMPTFDVLGDEGPPLLLCRHEQNAAFMARPPLTAITKRPRAATAATAPRQYTSRPRERWTRHRY